MLVPWRVPILPSGRIPCLLAGKKEVSQQVVLGDETTQSFFRGIISEAINYGSLINQPGFHGSCHLAAAQVVGTPFSPKMSLAKTRIVTSRDFEVI